ncbi:phosphopantetheine-binding protein [Puniceibacterium sp. IMCC21224]|uniref:phosphopantetheine-binding protein n=1 Tax=Puniceibacterium sp. IMCC21224 TaxID=1618204 RepID=UPI00064D738C|nr:phosphopantetheine-binding protein [Puniceibacterium sp. IMCC21224]KMK66994.1 aryl carrier domain [Puniceibacterium sp. IMCC21224]
MTPTFETLRTEVARQLRTDPATLGPDDSLLDLGLDSMRLMSLFVELENQGLVVDYALFLERPTLSGIWAAAGQGTAPA